MRYMFGLVALLVVVGIVLYLQAESASTVIKAAKPARETAERVSGQGVKESYAVTPEESGGRVTGLKITRLDAAGVMATAYDLQVGDIVTAVGPISIRDTDPDMLTAQLQEAAQRNAPLTVLRAGQKLTLELKPLGGAAKLLQGVPSH